MVLVAAITAIAIWLVPSHDSDTTSSLPELPSVAEVTEPLAVPEEPTAAGTPVLEPDATDPATAAATLAAEEAVAMETVAMTGTTESLDLPPPPGGIGTVTGGGEGARAFLYNLRASGGQPDADVVFTEAQRLQEAGDLENAYLLYRYAARHGQVQAALALGTSADPAYHSTSSSYLPEPSSSQAYKWYSKAASAGNGDAGQRLQALHAHVEKEAAAGDEQAQRLLLQWQ